MWKVLHLTQYHELFQKTLYAIIDEEKPEGKQTICIFSGENDNEEQLAQWVCDLFNKAKKTYNEENVKIPTTKEEATAMALVSLNWLKTNHPESLKTTSDV